MGRDPSGDQDSDPFEGSADFRSLGSRNYRWPRILNADEWTGMLATFSDHARLGEDRLLDLQLDAAHDHRAERRCDPEPVRHLRLDGAEDRTGRWSVIGDHPDCARIDLRLFAASGSQTRGMTGSSTGGGGPAVDGVMRGDDLPLVVGPRRAPCHRFGAPTGAGSSRDRALWGGNVGGVGGVVRLVVRLAHGRDGRLRRLKDGILLLRRVGGAELPRHAGDHHAGLEQQPGLEPQRALVVQQLLPPVPDDVLGDVAPTTTSRGLVAAELARRSRAPGR